MATEPILYVIDCSDEAKRLRFPDSFVAEKGIKTLEDLIKAVTKIWGASYIYDSSHFIISEEEDEYSLELKAFGHWIRVKQGQRGEKKKVEKKQPTEKPAASTSTEKKVEEKKPAAEKKATTEKKPSTEKKSTEEKKPNEKKPAGGDKKQEQPQEPTGPIIREKTGYGYFRFVIAEGLAPLTGLSVEQLFDLMEAPKNPENGDIALPVPKMKLKGNPAALAGEFVTKFPKGEAITEAYAIGPFMNFRINKSVLIQNTLMDIFDNREKYGNSTVGAGKKIVVEYSSPNIAKPFHAGHLRSTIIGNFIANVHDAMGYQTIRINYLGDWGKQYGLLAVGFRMFGKEEELQKDPIKHLFDVYVAVNAEADKKPEIHDEARTLFKKMEDGDEEALALWRRFRDLSIEKYKEIYARLNVKFDVYSGESLFGSLMEKEVNVLKEKGITKESEGALVIDLKDEGLSTVVVKKKDGATLYITRDIAAASYRQKEYAFEKMYYIVAMQQELHFKQLFNILEKMGYSWYKDCTHIAFGMVSGMSTRKGTVVFLEEILDEAKKVMHEVMKQNEVKYNQIEDPEYVSDVVGLSAVIVQDMGARRFKDYEFDWKRMTSFEGDTGPYLQFAHSRLCSIERKSGLEVKRDADLTLIKEPRGIEVVKILAKFPEILRSAFSSLEPCVIVTYAMELSHKISVCLEELWVMGTDKNVGEARLLLYWCARIVLGNCLRLIGLTPLERM